MELSINQLIKIIIGVVVITAVVGGLFIFGRNITDFFQNLPTGNISNYFVFLLK